MKSSFIIYNITTLALICTKSFSLFNKSSYLDFIILTFLIYNHNLDHIVNISIFNIDLYYRI